jgi:hypothetical protein
LPHAITPANLHKAFKKAGSFFVREFFAGLLSELTHSGDQGPIPTNA